MQLYILRNGKPTGPFDEPQIVEGWKRGTFRKDDLVWGETLENWTRLDSIIVDSRTELTAKSRPDAKDSRDKIVQSEIQTGARTTPYSTEISNVETEINSITARIEKCQARGFVGYCRRCDTEVQLYSDSIETAGPGVIVGTGNYGGSGIGMAVYRPLSRIETANFCRNCGLRVYASNIDQLIKYEDELKVKKQRNAELHQSQKLWLQLCHLRIKHPFFANILRFALFMPKLRLIDWSAYEQKYDFRVQWLKPTIVVVAALLLFFISPWPILSFILLCIYSSVPILFGLDSKHPLGLIVGILILIGGIYYLRFRFP